MSPPLFYLLYFSWIEADKSQLHPSCFEAQVLHSTTVSPHPSGTYENRPITDSITWCVWLRKNALDALDDGSPLRAGWILNSWSLILQRRVGCVSPTWTLNKTVGETYTLSQHIHYVFLKKILSQQEYARATSRNICSTIANKYSL